MQDFAYFCSRNQSLIRILSLKFVYIFILAPFFMLSCSAPKQEKIIAPWGEINDTITANDHFDLDEIQAGGELILLTLNGPQTYYDYRGKQLGTQFLIVEHFAVDLGVELRVEVCRDSVEILKKAKEGMADMMAFATPGDIQVLPGKPELEEEFRQWFRPSRIDDVRKEERYLFSMQSVRRHVLSPMLDRKKGVISQYDAYFIHYAPSVRWDWRLLAAQCYQESTFDARAVSWAGAKGLMQIMPSTADELGLPQDKLYDPESNIAAAVKYIGQLDAHFQDIGDRRERISFILAAYNGGRHHIRDAMALARRDGKNPFRWREVAQYVLRLSIPQYYSDPIVKYGYMRGTETVDYVDKIHQRWRSYQGIKTIQTFSGSMPQKATKPRKKKYNQ